MIKQNNYEQFLRSLIETKPVEITPDMITQELVDELTELEKLSQERLCESCYYYQLYNDDQWCYMFIEIPMDCKQFRKGAGDG